MNGRSSSSKALVNIFMELWLPSLSQAWIGVGSQSACQHASSHMHQQPLHEIISAKPSRKTGHIFVINTLMLRTKAEVYPMEVMANTSHSTLDRQTTLGKYLGNQSEIKADNKT